MSLSRSELSGDQRDLVIKFVEVTHCDEQRAEQVLRAAQWDIETGVQLFFAESVADAPVPSASTHESPQGLTRRSSGDVRPLSPTPASLDNSNQAPLLQTTSNGNEDPRAGDRLREGGMLSPVLGLASWCSTGIAELLYLIFRCGSGALGMLGSFLSSVFYEGGPSSINDILSAKFGPDHVQFFEGDFHEALSRCRQSSSYLLVYFHSLDSSRSDEFCSSFLACSRSSEESSDVRSLMESTEFVPWCAMPGLRTTHMAARLLGIRGVPALAVVSPFRGSAQGVGPPEAFSLVSQVQREEALDRGSVLSLLVAGKEHLREWKAERDRKEALKLQDRMLIEHQNREFEAGLEADRQRELAEREEHQRLDEERRRQEEASRKQRDLELSLESTRRGEAEEMLRRTFSAHPGDLQATKRLSDPVGRIALRLPEGQRVERNFGKEATVGDLYKWANCCSLLPENASKNLEVLKVPPPRFVLSTTFPTAELRNKELSLAEAGLLPDAMLVLSAVDIEDTSPRE